MKSFFHKYEITPARVFWHVLFWISFVAAHTLFYGYQDGSYGKEFAFAIRYLPFKMLITYFTLYVVIPRYLLKKKYIRAFLFFVTGVAGGTLLQQVIDYTILVPVFTPEWEREYLFYFSKMFKVFLGMYPVVTIAAVIKLAKLWYEKDRQTQELKRQKLEAELNFLKGQIHPHFLFNTLNNLYALTMKKSDDAPEVVMKLSELLSFMLYEGKADTIPVKKEIELIKHYTDLEKIRYDERLNFIFRKEGNFSGYEIPPMLLLPFVENAFKHGGKNETGPVSVLIDISLEGDVLTTRVENSKSDEHIIAENHVNGIGLKNIRRRLNLLYSGHHKLEIEETGNIFLVTLTIELNKLQLNPE
ncbi:MAG: histidine kinase [Balneolaceae bacterium]